MKQRLIDANKLRKDFLDLPNCYNGYSDTYDKSLIIEVVDEQPFVKAIPIEWLLEWEKKYNEEVPPEFRGATVIPNVIRDWEKENGLLRD